MVRIFLTEEDSNILHTLEEILTIHGHEIVAKTSFGNNVVEIFERTQPDLLLLDLNLPGKDRISIIKEILQKNPKAKIMVSMRNSIRSVIAECMKAGATESIEDFLKSGVLLKMISKIKF